jgi:hypothetical protein
MNLNEAPIATATPMVQGTAVSATLPPHRIATLRITFAEQTQRNN